VIHSFVVAHHPPVPPFAYPNVIVLVELAEGTRLVSRLVGTRPDDVQIGMRSRSTSRPSTAISRCTSSVRRRREMAAATDGDVPRRDRRSPASARRSFSKDSGRSELRLAVRGVMAALADAGLTPADVDGISTFMMDNNPEIEVARAIGAGPLRFFSRIHYGRRRGVRGRDAGGPRGRERRGRRRRLLSRR
jgi:hypothetical protein